MYSVTQLNTLAEFEHLWPRLAKLTRADNHSIDIEQLLRLFFHCLTAGAVFVVRGDAGLLGSCLVEYGPGDILVLHSIPNDKGTGIAKTCLAAVRGWAKDRGVREIQVTSTKLSGSSFRYFEKSLGFKRRAVTFALAV